MKKFISGSTLKIIAIVLMFIDHIGAAIFERGILFSGLIERQSELWLHLRQFDRILRYIGRPAFPIFCFLLVEGFLHTHDVKKYAERLFLFAFLSEIPFDMAIRGKWFDFTGQNVFFTLFIGLLVMIFCTKSEKHPFLQIVIMGAGLFAGWLLKTDYSFRGVFLIELLYVFRFYRIGQCLAGALAFSYELTAPLAFVPIYLYNGDRGIPLRYFFYWFYPVHLLILGLFARYAIPILL